MKRHIPIGLLALLLLVTVGCYWKGLEGPFLFDDYPNLQLMGEFGSVHDWQSLKAFVLGGWSGPTGRPISLLSFLLNDNTWPSNPESFKITNLGLHLICGLLLVWATYLLLRLSKYDDLEARLLAVISAGLWMLHPLQVSTTLYVVQRMTILSTLFILLGIVGYLKGRGWLAMPEIARNKAYLLMSTSVCGGTLLAILAKENGALLPVLVLVLEFFLKRFDKPAPNRTWIFVFLGLPSLLVLGYLARLIDLSPNPWPNRPFNQIERLLSESRIIWSYLYQLWVPKIEGMGLFQDGFQISRSIFQPLSTLWAVLSLVFLACLLPLLYRRYPFLWLALVFFFAGHLIESTVVALELYFEHRNYAPSMFMFLPVVVGFWSLKKWVAPRLIVTLYFLIFLIFGWLTSQRSFLWSDDVRLQTYWAIENPASARGRNYLISRLISEERYSDALNFADGAVQDIPSSSLLGISRLRLNVNTGRATEDMFAETANAMTLQPFDAQSVTGLRTLVDDVVSVHALKDYRIYTQDLIGKLSEKGPYKDFPLFLRLVAYLNAKIDLSMGKYQSAFNNYEVAMDRYAQAASAMQMFSEMAGAGQIDLANKMLDSIEKGIDSGKFDTKPLDAAYYRNEVRRMREQLAQ